MSFENTNNRKVDAMRGKMLAIGAFCVASAFGEMIIAPSFCPATNRVDSGTMTQDDSIFVSSESCIYKTGAGKWEIPWSYLTQGWPVNFGVLGGSLEFFSICRSKAFLGFSLRLDVFPVASLAIAGGVLSIAESCDSTCCKVGWTIWKNGTSVPAVNMPQTIPINSRKRYLRAYFQTRR